MPFDGVGTQWCDVCFGAHGDRDFEDVAGRPDFDHVVHARGADDDANAGIMPAWLGGLDFGNDQTGPGGLACDAGELEDRTAPGLLYVGGEFGDVLGGAGGGSAGDY